MKRRLYHRGLLISILLIISMLLTCGIASAQAFKPIKLKYAGFVPGASFVGKWHQWWADEVKKRTGGKIEVEMYWMGSLVKVDDMLHGIQSGVADLGHFAATYTPQIFPLLMILDAPANAGENYYAAMMASLETKEKEPSLKAELDKAGVIVFAPYFGGEFYIGTKKYFDSINSLKAKTVRSLGGPRIKFLENLGVNPVFMGYADIYEAVDRGTIDGAEILMQLSHGFKHYEVMKCVIPTYSGSILGNGIGMNLKVYNKLPKDLQDVLRKLDTDFAFNYGKALKEMEADSLNTWVKKHGVKILNLAPEERKLMIESAERAREVFINKQEADGHPARKVWDYYWKALKKYEAQSPKKG